MGDSFQDFLRGKGNSERRPKIFILTQEATALLGTEETEGGGKLYQLPGVSAAGEWWDQTRPDLSLSPAGGRSWDVGDAAQGRNGFDTPTLRISFHPQISSKCPLWTEPHRS